MPPKPKNTKEEITAAAVEVIRREGISSLSARNIAKILNCAPSSLFTHFASMTEITEEALKSCRDVYNSYVEKGLQMFPPFKGFGMELMHFARSEPQMFSALFLQKESSFELEKLVVNEGHLAQVIQAVIDVFHLEYDQAMRVYQNMYLYLVGLATMSQNGLIVLSEEEIARMFGNACRGFVASERMPKDARADIMPDHNRKIEGSVEEYIGGNGHE